MFIKIENEKITEWADWQFEGSEFVDIDYNLYSESPERFKIENGELIDLVDTDIYKNKQRLIEIEGELNHLDELYYAASQTPVEFENHQYKFEWTTLYQGLLNSGILPAKIWDLTELEENAVLMDEEKLQSLQNCLLTLQETAFQTRKEARSLLLNEKEQLEQLIKE